jgi:hypothetical protein
MTKENKKPILSRPKDKTWQSYRDWFLSLSSYLLGRPVKNEHSDEEWQKIAEEFWAAGRK